MKGELLSIETANKLAKLDQVTKYINDTLKQAYTTYGLSSDAVVQLLTIQNIIIGENNGSRR